MTQKKPIHPTGQKQAGFRRLVCEALPERRGRDDGKEQESLRNLKDSIFDLTNAV